MGKSTCTAKFEIEMDKEEMVLLGAAATPDGRILGEVLLGIVADVIRSANAQVPYVLKARIPSVQELLAGQNPPVQVLTHKKGGAP